MKVLSGVLVLADGLVRAARKAEDGLTLQEAAGRLGMHPEAVLHVARTGLLPGRREGRGWRFTMSEVESFDAEHVTGARMAALLGTSPRSAIAGLVRLCAWVVAGPPACRQAIFRRTDAERAACLTTRVA
ncbi:helix-turn-helix domain-containing protein [Aurantimonas endophytica]|uniref:helix-turn-helix domain-containing protein n=1 Tax=Aurantimonas endophytica TaxID=1522175 RepID=UPI00338FB514